MVGGTATDADLVTVTYQLLAANYISQVLSTGGLGKHSMRRHLSQVTVLQRDVGVGQVSADGQVCMLPARGRNGGSRLGGGVIHAVIILLTCM